MAERLNLVTGGSGFTGSYVVRQLLDSGHSVIATDRPGAFSNEETRYVMRKTGLDLEHPNLELIEADLLDQGSLSNVFSTHAVTHVFHTASLYDYTAPLSLLMKVNVDGTKNLLRALEHAPIERFIHWSTCGVFGKPHTAAHGEKNNLPFNEDSSSPKNTPMDAEHPEGTELVNDYSISKWKQEKLLWNAYQTHGFPVTVVRPAPIYGPGSSYGHGGIMLAIATGLLRVAPLDTRNYITTSVHVEDIAGFACYVAELDQGVGEDYNVVDNSIISYYEFIQYIALLTGRKLIDLPWIRLDKTQESFARVAKVWRWFEQTVHVPRIRVFEPQSANYVSSSYWLSNRKSLMTGYQYRYPEVREGLKDTIGWFREMGWLTDRRKLWVVSPLGAKANNTR